jgi:hypothetical protein
MLPKHTNRTDVAKGPSPTSRNTQADKKSVRIGYAG